MSGHPSAPAVHGSAIFSQQVGLSQGLLMDVCAKLVTVRDNRKEGAQTCINTATIPKCYQPSSSR